MISSEVKRTLVKSPPELWTELSDPAALARHLGEFGEIRITRSEPEQLVEWESERASGRVMLKPSGWGTKVTLTVEGELPGGPPGPPSAAPDVPEPLAPVESSDLAEPLAPVESLGVPEPLAPLESLGVPEPLAPVESSDVPEPIAPVESPNLAELAEPVRAIDPSTAAGEIIDDDDRALEIDERWDEEREVELVPPPHSAAAIAAEVAGEDRPITLEPHLDAEAAAEAHLEPEPAIAALPTPEARRGFFARLFGRGTPAVEAPIAEPAPRSDPLPPPIGAPAQRAAPEEHAPEPIAPPEHAPEPAHRAAPEPIASEEHAPERVAAADPLPGYPAAAEPLRGHVEPTAAAEQGQEEIVPAAPAENDPTDLAAELQIAEAEAAEQVKLVLTSVLDRLGSAHHRPFSRS